jgi:hypothetical protein
MHEVVSLLSSAEDSWESEGSSDASSSLYTRL